MKIKPFDIENSCESMIYTAISRGRFPHAAIIEGGTAAERMELAKKTAAALLCSGTESKPCGECSHCIKVAADSHADVPVYSVEDKPKAFKVDMVRDIRSEAFILPNEADRKVFILENAHTMGAEGQNAFLKVLEEPPEFVTFLLLCTTRTVFLPTVLSRAVVYGLGTEGTGSEEEFSREELISAAGSIALSLLSPNDFETVKEAGIFEKNTKLLRAALPVMQEIFAGALRYKYSAEEANDLSELSSKLASRLGRKALLSLTDASDELMASLDMNANLNLTVTRLCTLLRSAAAN